MDTIKDTFYLICGFDLGFASWNDLNPSSDIEKWSNAVDRHLSQLQKEKTLFKLSGGLYFCPRESPFGPVPPNDYELVKFFLKTIDS